MLTRRFIIRTAVLALMLALLAVLLTGLTASATDYFTNTASLGTSGVAEQSASAVVEVLFDPGPCAPLLTEDFEGAATPALPSSWATVSVYFPSGTQPKWATSVGTVHPSGGGAHSGTKVVYFNSYSVAGPKSARLYYTNPLNGLTQLQFWMYHDTGYAGSNDTAQVQVSTDSGVTWDNVGAPFIRDDSTTGWRQETVDLSAYSAQPSVMIGILGISGFGNDVHLDDITVCGLPGPQLALAKSVSPAAAKPGEAITYTITFSNTGAITATNVVLTDTLSANITNASYTSSGVALTLVPGSQYVWTAPDLPQNEGGVITITGVLTKPLAAGVFTNTVTMAVSGTVKTADAPLTVENVVPMANAGPDQTVGPGAAVTLNGSGTDDNGDALTYGWVQTGGTPTVTLSDPTAPSPTFTAPVTPNTVLTFTLTVTDTQGLASEPDTVVVVVAQPTDLAISKEVQVGYLTGVTYTIVARNLGPNAADGAVVSDTLTHVISPTWTCVAAGGAEPATASGTGDVQHTLTAFPVGGIVTCTVRGMLIDRSHVRNTAEIIAPAGVTDTDTSNNSATVERWQIFLPVVWKNYGP